MARNSSGTYSLASTPFVSNTGITATSMNADFNDIASIITVSLPTTGVAPMTGQLKLFVGAVNNPSITFTTSTTTGFYNSATNEISVVVNGTQTAKINSSGLTMVGKTITDKNGNVVYGLPIGVVMPYAGSLIPNQWLFCFGQSLSRTTYAALFAVISTTYGSVDGNSFSLPDLRGRAVFGVDNMGGSAANRITNAGSGITGTTLGATGGTQNITIAKANIPNVASFTKTDPTHNHSYQQGATNSNAAGGASSASPGTSAGQNTGSSSIGSTWTTGGSGTAVVQLPPLLITNYMIFTGV